MSLDKTIKHNYRLPTDFEKYAVYDALPLYFEKEYPKLIAFMEKYFEFEDNDGFGAKLKDLEVKRDLVEASDELLRFFSKELLLGRDYFDNFIDKKTAIAVSNLLYRSKGTKYSIQQFFRVFFGFDVEIRYGRDEVFLVGDPYEELLIYEAKYKGTHLYPGNRLRFEFDDGSIQVSALREKPEEVLTPADYVETTEDFYRDYSMEYGPTGTTKFKWANEGYETPEFYDGRYAYTVDDYVEPFTRSFIYDLWEDLRQDIDFTIDYADKSILLQKVEAPHEPVHQDPWILALATDGFMSQEGQKVKIEIKRDAPAGSPIGPDVSEKRITNNGFWQMFSLLIKTPISISKWRESYKDFVHPAGMYLEGQVAVESVARLGIGKQENAITDQYRLPVHSTVELEEFVYTMITELNIRGGTARIMQMNPRGAPNNPWLDSDGTIAYPDEVYRSRLNDVKHLNFTLEELDRQYDSDLGMARIDDIAPRTFIETSIDMSNTINTLDENKWHDDFIENFCPRQHVLGSTLDFPIEYPGCPNLIFAVGPQTIQGQYYSPKLMNEYYYGDSAPSWAVDPDHPKYIGEQFRTTPGPVNGIVDVKFTAYRDNRVWDDYVADDYTIEIPSETPSSKWIGNTDYANRFQRAQISATVVIYNNYFRGGYMYADDNVSLNPDDIYMEKHLVDSSGA